MERQSHAATVVYVANMGTIQAWLMMPEQLPQKEERCLRFGQNQLVRIGEFMLLCVKFAKNCMLAKRQRLFPNVGPNTALFGKEALRKPETVRHYANIMTTITRLRKRGHLLKRLW